MPRLPQFAEPSSYVRFFGGEADFPQLRDTPTELRFLRLGAREGPLKYPWRQAAVPPGVSGRTQPKTFSDLRQDPDHIAQVYVGLSYGTRARLYHPFDTRLLKWDKLVQDVSEQDTATLEYEDSPMSAPRKSFWIAPTENLVPALDFENVLSLTQPPRNIDCQALFLASQFQFEFVDHEREPELHDKLLKFQIPSQFITFGGVI